MAGKGELKDDLELRDCYTLMEPDPIIINHRTLRRQLCISHVVIFILIIPCTVFSAIYFIQQVNVSKNNDNVNKEKANETREEFQFHTLEAKEADVQKPLMAFLTFKPYSEKANLTLQRFHIRMDDFCLSDTCENLTIPRDGRYKIGLQITYKTKEEKQTRLAHNVMKKDKSYEGEIFEVLTVYDTVYSNSDWFKSMYSEIFHVFNKGDIVWVQSGNANLIYYTKDPHTYNFFTIQFFSEIMD